MEKLDSRVYCRTCKNRNHHGIIKSHEESSNVPWDISYQHFYYIVQCLGCDTVSFVSEYGDESMIDLDEFGDQRHFTDITVYPEEPRTEKNSKYEPHVKSDLIKTPEPIQMMYSQIVSAFNMQSYLLAAVGLRMLIEGICKDLSIQDGYLLDENGVKKTKKDSPDEVISKSLEGKINRLVEKGIVVQNQANILHQVREIGNASAHELQTPKRKTVILAIEILEKILEQIYELQNYEIK